MISTERSWRTATKRRHDLRPALRSWALHGAVFGGAAGVLTLDRRWGRSRPALAQAALPAVTVGFYALIKKMEDRHPFTDEWRAPRPEQRTDAAFVASSIVGTGLGRAAAALARRAVFGAKRSNLELGRRLPTAAGVAVGLLSSDFVHTHWHHLAHVWGPGWRIHSVHHSPTRLYWLNATRFHVADLFVEGFVDSLVFSFLGLNRRQDLGFTAIRAMYGQLQHCNVDLRSGILDRIFATPDLHRWHHSTIYAEGDTNFGAVLSIWDQVSGWYFRPDDRDAPDELGVGRMPDFPQRFVELQRTPLDWDDICDRNADTWYADVADAR